MTNLTTKEQTALNFLARNNGCGATTKVGLRDDNFSWFNAQDLMKGLGLNQNEAAGIMSALNAKGMAFDDEAGTKAPQYGRDTWTLSNAGIDASNLGE